MESSDARLVDGLRRGTPAAFAGLHERYATGIYNLALRVVRHGPDAEDITQDVLIRAFERLPQRPRGAVAAVAVPAHAEPLLRLPARDRPAAAAGRDGRRPAVSAGSLRPVGAAAAARGGHRRPDPPAAGGAAAQGRPRALAGRGGGVPGPHAGIGRGAARPGTQVLPGEVRRALPRRGAAVAALGRRPRWRCRCCRCRRAWPRRRLRCRSSCRLTCRRPPRCARRSRWRPGAASAPRSACRRRSRPPC